MHEQCLEVGASAEYAAVCRDERALLLGQGVGLDRSDARFSGEAYDTGCRNCARDG